MCRKMVIHLLLCALLCSFNVVYAIPVGWQSTTTDNSSAPTKTPTTAQTVPLKNLYGIQLGSYSYSATNTQTLTSCSSTATGTGSVGTLLVSPTFTSTGSSNYNSTVAVTWEGDGPPECRTVSLAASGGGSVSVSAACSCDNGVSASCSASFGGTCSSLGDANASKTKELSVDVQYASATSNLSVDGNVGASVTDNSASVEGNYDQSTSFNTSGTGAKSGSAIYTVKSTRTYSEYTDVAYTKSRSGNTTATGSGAFNWMDSASYTSSATCNLTV